MFALICAEISSKINTTVIKQFLAAILKKEELLRQRTIRIIFLYNIFLSELLLFRKEANKAI